MRLASAADALHLFLGRATDEEFEALAALFRNLPATYEGRGVPPEKVGQPRTTASRRASLSFAVDRLLASVAGRHSDTPTSPAFIVLDTHMDTDGSQRATSCHAGAWGASGTESLGDSIGGRSRGRVRVDVVQLLSSRVYQDGVLANEYRYPADWAEPDAPLDQSGFASAHD